MKLFSPENITANNVIATIGRTENSVQRIDLLANTGLQTVSDFQRLVISEDRGVQIDLGLFAEQPERSVWENSPSLRRVP